MVARDNQFLPRVNNDGPLNFFDYESPNTGIRPQNMPHTSNTLLSPIKSMVAVGNQWQPRTSRDGKF